MRICNLSNSCPFPKNPFLKGEQVFYAKPTSPTEGQGESDFAPFADRLKEVVPGKQGEQEDLMVRHEHWISILGPYNQIQVHINSLHELRKKLSDPGLVNTPEFKERLQNYLQQEYKKMEKVLGVLPNVENSLKDSIRNNAISQFNVDRVGALRVTDRLVAELTKQRKIELAKVGETLKEDLSQRVIALHEKWDQNPPAGYEEYREPWMKYCDKLLETLQGQDMASLDDGTKDSPIGSELLKEAEVWWDKLSHMEDSYTDFTHQDVSQFTVENAQRVYNDLKEKRKTILSDQVVSEFQHAADQVLTKGAETKAIIEAKIKQIKDDPLRKQDLETLQDSLKQLKEKMEDLRAKKDVKKAVDEVFTGKEELTRIQVPNELGYVVIPKGIEGQLQALREVPLSTQGRRQVIRTLLESMEAVEGNLKGYKTYAEVTLAQVLIDMDLFQKGLETDANGSKREMMLINPFATLGHVWHSYSEAVKGNVETDEKRGAGYFQRDATKIFNKMPKIPLVQDISVVKSLTELSVNGAVEAEHAEHGRIGKYEKDYEAVPVDHLTHMAEEASDQWELQGCLKVLAKSGRINWYAPWLFEALNKYQKNIHIPEDRHWHMRNLTQSNELMRQAFVYIYRDEDVYRNLRNTNLSSYESKMAEYNKQWGVIAAQDGALKKRAEAILDLYESDHQRGAHNSKANPIEFESIIRYGVEWGKMKMEDRFNLLVRGIASGLLSFDRGVNATDKNNNYPPYDYFDTGTARGGKPTYDDVLEWAAYAKNPETWDYFMHKSNGVMNNKSVNERLLKTMTQGSHRLDHDDAAGIAGYLTMDITRDLLKAKTQGGYGMPVTGLKSLSTGNEFWLRMFAEEYQTRSPADRKNEMIRFASQFVMLEGIMNERVFKESQDYYRLKAGPDRQDPPRFSRGGYAKVFKVKTPGYSEKAGTAEILSYVAQKIMMLDPDEPYLLQKLLTGKIRTNDDAATIARQLEAKTNMFDGSPPKDINGLYAAMPKYFDFILQDSTQMEQMVAAICSEHGQHTSEMDHRIEHDIQHIRDAARQRGLTGREPEHHSSSHDKSHDKSHGGEAGGHSGEHPAEGNDAGSVHGSTPIGGGASSSGSTHGGQQAANNAAHYGQQAKRAA